MKNLFLLLILLASMGQAAAQDSKDTPRVWEGPLVIPTYELNPPNPYPALLDSNRRKWRPVKIFIQRITSSSRASRW